MIVRPEQHEATRSDHGLEPGFDRRWISAFCKLFVHVRLEAPELLLERCGKVLERLVRRQANVFDFDGGDWPAMSPPGVVSDAAFVTSGNTAKSESHAPFGKARRIRS